MYKQDASKFAERLKELRIEKHLSQEKLEIETKISQTAISAYERRVARPTDDVIIAFCHFFKVSADYLLGLTD